MLLAAAIERLYDLNVGTTPLEEGAPHEKPHKPLLLLAAFDLIDEGLATSERIPWCQELRARFTDGFQYLVAIPANRQLMREALIARYFPHISFSSHSKSNIQNSTSLVAEDTPEYGRSSHLLTRALRPRPRACGPRTMRSSKTPPIPRRCCRKIFAIYDHQCAACGLRIKLPAGSDVSFIDAAHLIPFSESQNDHPTNGLALCKNHHWAMDRNLIAPAPDHHWHVSKVPDPRRSSGEKELIALSRQALLLPQDEAFHPDAEGLKWRCKQLSA